MGIRAVRRSYRFRLFYFLVDFRSDRCVSFGLRAWRSSYSIQLLHIRSLSSSLLLSIFNFTFQSSIIPMKQSLALIKASFYPERPTNNQYSTLSFTWIWTHFLSYALALQMLLWSCKVSCFYTTTSPDSWNSRGQTDIWYPRDSLASFNNSVEMERYPPW